MGEKGLILPDWIEQSEPVDGTELDEDEDVQINGDENNIVGEDLLAEIEQFGKFLEPEIEDDDEEFISMTGYANRHWTHFNFNRDVKRSINRVQGKFPWKTFANTYYQHPPGYNRKWEFRSVDYWGGGLRNGRYAGYRGKPIGRRFGQRVFNAIFNDPYRPNIAWIIFNGYRWQRYGGWGRAPWGPAGSDAGHYKHIHVTYMG